MTFHDLANLPEDDPVTSAVMRAENVLLAGLQFGLYELIWGLRGADGNGTDAVYLPHARQALDRLLDLDLGVLREARWAKPPAGPVLDRADLEDSWFAAPDEDTDEYVVLDTVRERPDDAQQRGPDLGNARDTGMIQ